MKPITLSLLTLMLVGMSAACLADPLPSTYNPAQDPEKDLAAATAIAQKAGRNILLQVGDSACSWCNALDRWLAENADINDCLNKNYVVVKIYYGATGKQFLSTYPKLPGIPHFYILSPGGALLYSQETGSLEKGTAYDREKFLAFLKKWVAK